MSYKSNRQVTLSLAKCVSPWKSNMFLPKAFSRRDPFGAKEDRLNQTNREKIDF